MKRIKTCTTEISINGQPMTSCQFCQICEVNADEITEMINHGLLEDKGRSLKSWRFTTNDILRVKRAKRLQQDFELNLSGVTFVIELLDELNHLREKLSHWEKQPKTDVTCL